MRNDENTNQKYTLLWDGKEIQVTREVYKLMFQDRDEDYNEWRRRKRHNVEILSYDLSVENGYDEPSGNLNPEEMYIANDSFFRLIENLTICEQRLIIARFHYCFTEEELAECLSIRQQSLNERIARILQKIENMIQAEL